MIVHTNLVSHDGQDQSDRVGPFGSLSSIAQPPGCIDRLQWYELIKSEVTLGLTSMFVKAGFVLDLNDTNSIMFNFRGGITDDGFRVDVRWKINQENLFFMRMAEQRVFMVHYADAFKSGLTVKDWLPQHDMTLYRDGLQYLTIASCPGGLGEVFHHSSGNDVTQPEFGVSLPQFTFGDTPLLSEHMDTLDVDVGDHPHYNDLRVKVEEVVEQEEADLDDSDLEQKTYEEILQEIVTVSGSKVDGEICHVRPVDSFYPKVVINMRLKDSEDLCPTCGECCNSLGTLDLEKRPGQLLSITPRCKGLDDKITLRVAHKFTLHHHGIRRARHQYGQTNTSQLTVEQRKAFSSLVDRFFCSDDPLRVHLPNNALKDDNSKVKKIVYESDYVNDIEFSDDQTTILLKSEPRQEGT